MLLDLIIMVNYNYKYRATIRNINKIQNIKTIFFKSLYGILSNLIKEVQYHTNLVFGE